MSPDSVWGACLGSRSPGTQPWASGSFMHSGIRPLQAHRVPTLTPGHRRGHEPERGIQLVPSSVFPPLVHPLPIGEGRSLISLRTSRGGWCVTVLLPPCFSGSTASSGFVACSLTSCCTFFFLFFCFVLFCFKIFIYLFMRDTEREREREIERQRRRQREKQAPCREPDMGLDPRSLGSHPGLKVVLNRRATQAAPS